MHELSIALEVCRMAEDHVGRRHLPQVVGVDLEVGDQSGIEIDNLMFCLEALLSNPPFVSARPTITRTAGDELRLTSLEIDDGRPDH